MRLRMASRRTRDPAGSPSRLTPPSSFETQTQAGLLLRMRGGRVFPAASAPQSLRHPGLDPGSRAHVHRAEIPGRARDDGRGGRWQRAKRSRQSAAPPHAPGKVQRSGTLSGIQRNMRRAAARSCLKTKWKRASRGVLRWTPDTLPLSLQGSGDVPRGGTFSFRERAACGMLELPNWPSCAGRPWRRGQSPAILPHCDGRGVDAVAGCVVANASDEVRAPGFAHAGDWSDALMRRRMERRR